VKDVGVVLPPGGRQHLGGQDAVDGAALSHLRRERELTNKSVGSAIADLLREQRDQYKQELSAEVRQLRIELTNLETTLAELRSVMASERAQVVDIPSPLSRVRSN
jgi:hypothetical protein